MRVRFLFSQERYHTSISSEADEFQILLFNIQRFKIELIIFLRRLFDSFFGCSFCWFRDNTTKNTQSIAVLYHTIAALPAIQILIGHSIWISGNLSPFLLTATICVASATEAFLACVWILRFKFLPSYSLVTEHYCCYFLKAWATILRRRRLLRSNIPKAIVPEAMEFGIYYAIMVLWVYHGRNWMPGVNPAGT